MANYRKRYSKMTGKWTPVAAVGKTFSTRKVAECIDGVAEVERNAMLALSFPRCSNVGVAKESTVSIADIMAVLY